MKGAKIYTFEEIVEQLKKEHGENTVIFYQTFKQKPTILKKECMNC